MGTEEPEKQGLTEGLKDLRHQAWDFVGVMVAIVCLLVAVVAYYSGKRAQARPAITMETGEDYELIGYLADVDPDIRVFYRGTEVRYLSVTYLTLTNSGNTPIRPGDYISPITVTVQSGAQLAGVEIVAREPAEVDLEITEIVSNTFHLSESLLNPADAVLFRLSLIGDPDDWVQPYISAGGRIAGVKEIEMRSTEGRRIVSVGRTWYTLSFWELLIMAVGTAVVLFAVLALMRRRAPGFYACRFVDAKLTALAIATTAVVFWIRGLVGFAVVGVSASHWKAWSLIIGAGGVFTVVYLAAIGYAMSRARRSPGEPDDKPVGEPSPVPAEQAQEPSQATDQETVND